MSIKRNDSNKGNRDMDTGEFLSEGYGPTVILFAGIALALLVLSFF